MAHSAPLADGYHVETNDLRPTMSVVFPLLVVLGIAARLALALGTHGTNDMVNWERFARAIEADGLMNLYAANSNFNHPPLMGFLAAALVRIADSIGVPFYAVFKTVIAAGDCAVIVLLYRLWSMRRGSPVGWQIAALYSLNLLTILISGYHGNTDTLYCLGALGALFLALQSRFFLSGLALGAALNVKLIPLILAIPFVCSLNQRRQLAAWLSGFAIGLIPLGIAAALSGGPFVENVVHYRPVADNWGIVFFLRLFRANNPDSSVFFTTALDWYIANGRFVILGLILAISVWNRYSKRLSLAQLLGISAALFMVFASGFGLQYFALVITLVFAAEPRWGVRLSAATGITALLAYAHFMVSLAPALSIHNSTAPKGLALVFAITWLLLTFFIAELLFVRKDTPAKDA